MVADDCISLRARVRKSPRAIDPEFDVCQEMIVSFVMVHHKQQLQHSTSNCNSSSKSPASQINGPSLLLTPIPTMMMSRTRSLSLTGMMMSTTTTPVNKLQRSIGSGGTITTSTFASPDKEGGSMVDVPLDDKEDGGVEGENIELMEKGGSNNIKLNGLPPTQPPTTISSALQQQQNHPLRYPSPLVMHRSSSGASSTNISTSLSDPQPGGGGSSVRSRSRSRSRTGSIPNSRRLRSLGAAMVFASAASSSLGNSHNSSNQTKRSSSLPNQQCENNWEGGQESVGEGAGGDVSTVEPITIPLRDVLGVDEEVPHQMKRSESNSGGGGGSNTGCGNNSEFYSSAASDIGVAKAAATTPSTLASVNPQHPLLSSPPPSTTHSGRPSHRIFLHTLSSGYLEFSLDNANSHDSFMAYLKAHLPSDRIPCRNNNSIGSSSYISSSAPTKVTNHVGGVGMLRTMVLTPTKELPSNLSGTTTSTVATTTSGSGDNLTAHHFQQQQARPTPPPTPTIAPSSSASVCSNRIDKLHSKMMHQRLHYEKNSRPPIVRMKERMVNWMSTVIDCGCCFDTTVVAPLETVNSVSVGETTPKTKTLKKRGIGGLSFEVESCVSSPTPNLSFER
ncbi:hypothetical protein ACHAXH_007494 [Discostella pseudostelligera]